MQKVLFSIVTLAMTVAMAQTQPAQSQTLKTQQSSDKNIWLEVNIPFTENGGFGDALADSKKTSTGSYGLSFGWEPFHKMETGNKVKKFFKSAGFTFNATVNNNNPDQLYDVYLGSIYTLLSPFETTLKCGGQYTGGPQCVSCGYDENGFGRTCTAEPVYGRFAPLKYSPGSVAVGMYIPMQIAKLVIQAGVNARLHLTREGTMSNELKSGTEMSYAGTIRVAYPVYKNISATAGFEQSFTGSKSGDSRFRYRAYTIGASIRW